MFPYVLAHLESYLAAHYGEEQTRQDIRDLIRLSQHDQQEGVSATLVLHLTPWPTPPPFPPSSPADWQPPLSTLPPPLSLLQLDVVVIPEDPIFLDPSLESTTSPPSSSPSYPLQLSSLIANVRAQMAADRKSTPLKQLQGHMWAVAYHSGLLSAPLYPDVHAALPVWAARGIRLAVYSSGSEEAQRLVFGYTDRGDVGQYLQGGYWDTRMGMKQQADSYRRIMQQMGVEQAQRLLFLTDVEAEARACRQAGGQAMVVVREGNKAVDPMCGIPLIRSFAEVDVEAV